MPHHFHHHHHGSAVVAGITNISFESVLSKLLVSISSQQTYARFEDTIWAVLRRDQKAKTGRLFALTELQYRKKWDEIMLSLFIATLNFYTLKYFFVCKILKGIMLFTVNFFTILIVSLLSIDSKAANHRL